MKQKEIPGDGKTYEEILNDALVWRPQIDLERETVMSSSSVIDPIGITIGPSELTATGSETEVTNE